MPFSSLSTDGAVLIEVGARLTAARSALGLSSDDLAARCGLDRATVDRAEAGEPVSLGNFIGLLRALDLLDGLESVFRSSAGSADPLVEVASPPTGTSATPAPLPGSSIGASAPAAPPPEPKTGFVMRDNRGRHRAPARRGRGPVDRRSSGGPKPPGRFIWGDDPPPNDA